MTPVGVDVSKLTIDCAWQLEGRWYHHRWDNTESGFRQALSVCPDSAHWVMEATGVYHQQLSQFLYGKGCQVSVVNPLVIKRYGQMNLKRAKTDKADAKLIAEYAMERRPKAWRPTSPAMAKLQHLEHWQQQLIKQRTQLKNQREALHHSGEGSDEVDGLIQQQLTLCQQQIRTCERRLQQGIKALEAELYEQLISIPGIGGKTARHLILVTDGFRRFDNAKQLVAYAGLAPRVHTSGTSVVGSRGIVKMGSGLLRQLLYLCSWTACKANPGCKSLAERLQAKGKPGKVICVAVANKLLRQAFAVAKAQQKFNAELCMG